MKIGCPYRDLRSWQPRASPMLIVRSPSPTATVGQMVSCVGGGAWECCVVDLWRPGGASASGEGGFLHPVAISFWGVCRARLMEVGWCGYVALRWCHQRLQW
jgi:hypothetical protein